MIAANLAFALAVAIGVMMLFLVNGFAYWECLTAYALCGGFSVLAFAWASASASRTPVRTDQRS